MHSPFRLPRLLLTNDDGFDAPGLAVLIDIAQEFAKEVWVLAPAHDQSGTSQGITLNEPLRCFPRGSKRWAVNGTGADCVALALTHFMAQSPPALILSGINSDTNLGDEVNLSGTVGAAFMGLTLGIPSIAFHQAGVKLNGARWQTARAIVPKVLAHLLRTGWRRETCLSVNLPDLPPESITRLSWTRQAQRNIAGIGVRAERHRQQDYFWLSLHTKEPDKKGNTDHACVMRGEVAVTALALDRSVEITSPPVAFGEASLVAADDE